MNRRHAPVVVARELGGIESGLREDQCVGDRHLAAVGFLPHQALDVVGRGAVAVVGVRGRVDGVIRVFTRRGRVAGRLPGVGQCQHAPAIADDRRGESVGELARGRADGIGGALAAAVSRGQVVAHRGAVRERGDRAAVNAIARCPVLMRAVVGHRNVNRRRAGGGGHDGDVIDLGLWRGRPPNAVAYELEPHRQGAQALGREQVVVKELVCVNGAVGFAEAGDESRAVRGKLERPAQPIRDIHRGHPELDIACCSRRIDGAGGGDHGLRGVR